MENKFAEKELDAIKLYNIFSSHIVKKIIVFLLFSLLLFVIIGLFLILFLADETNRFDAKKDVVDEMKLEMLRLQSNLDEHIIYYQMEKDRVNELEAAIGIKPYEEKITADDIKINYLLLSLAQKQMILDVIPNGEVIKHHRGVSDGFGNRIHPISKTEVFHKGVDFRADLKTPVYSAANGVVEFAGANGGFGFLVAIKHGFGFKTYYAHLDQKPVVRVGQAIKKGEHIANSGNSGLSTGPHLHYEVKYLGVSLDPMNFIKWNISNFDTVFVKEKKVQWDQVINLVIKSNIKK
ncbi:MAG: M23 family metallopeptidase [Campylobacteraceae bacterium]|nr:M23 family metallopeptidase [Campylobacteraceae bacterium]